MKKLMLPASSLPVTSYFRLISVVSVLVFLGVIFLQEEGTSEGQMSWYLKHAGIKSAHYLTFQM